MKIEYKPISPEFQKWKCPFQMTPIGVCIHNTANHASADNEISYMSSSGLSYKDGHVTVLDSDLAYRSYHYAVDEYKGIQAIPHNRNAWHAGDGTYGIGNRNYIAIEICKSEYDSDREAFEKAQENSAELVAIILHEYGWGWNPERIKKHEDFSKKHCPHRTLDDYGWDFYLNLVKQKYEELYPEEIPMTKEEKKYYDEKIKQLEARLQEYDDMGVYDNTAIRWAYIDGNLPKWATPTIKKLVHNDFLKGNGENSFELSYMFMRIWVILDRMGLIDFAINFKKNK